jgi:hypothetical protein
MRPECKDKTQQERDDCRGVDGVCCAYDIVIRNNYCDKGGHKERSIANQPNHAQHWRKVKSPPTQS